MKKLLGAKECAYKAYIENLGLIGEEAHQYKLAKIIKSFIQDNTLNDLKNVKFNEANLAPQLDALDFTLAKQKEIISKLYVNNVAEIATELISNGYNIVDKNINLKLKINNREIFLKIDLVLQNSQKEYFAVTIQSGKGNYTKNELQYEYSLEWYIRSLFADELASKYPGIRPAKLHLKECNKKNGLGRFLIIPDIDKTIIKQKYDKELNETINILVNKNSCKTPDYSKCNSCPARNLCEFFRTNTNELKKVTREKVQNKNMELTEAQESLINSNPGIYRVLAGAGTGKTTTIMNKVVAMIQDGINPKDILIITFTEKGIQEIKEKLDYWLKEWFITEISSKDFPIYTFNGYGDVVLKENYKRFGYTAEPTLIDSVEKVEIIKEILDSSPTVAGLHYENPLYKQWNYMGAVHEFTAIIDKFKKLSTDPVKLSEYIEELTKKYKDFNILKDMIDRYYKHLHDNNLCEYEDQTNALVDICTVGYEDLFEKYAKDIVICDEFQDTDDKQLLFVRACARRDSFHSLTMVGDDSQSVFAWRGARQDIILNLDQYFKDLEDIKMLENFRSTKEITDLANKVNNLRDDIVKKDLISVRSGKAVELQDTLSKKTPEEIVNKIKELIQNGANLYDIGVIARRKQELQSINILLQEAKIPCLVSVHEFLIDNPKIKNILGLPIFLLDNEKTLYLAEYLQAKDSDKFDSQTDIGVYVAEEAKRITEELDAIKAVSTNFDKDLVDYFFTMLNDLDLTDKALLKLKEILESKTFANLVEMQQFLSKLKAYDSQLGVEKDEEAYDAVTLMTPHSAKGREFKIILASLDDFKFSENTDNEDNRCLFVTITRAMEELYLYGNSSKASYYEIIEEML